MKSKKGVRKLFISFGVFLSLIVSEQAYSFDIQVMENGDTVLWGMIENGDYEKVIQHLRGPHPFPMSLKIISPGGDVEEAIKIGRLVRSTAINVEAVASCNSACFLIWMGSPNRTHAGSEFILHRPYFDKTYYSELSLAEANVRYAELEELFREYLMEMGTPGELINKIESFNSTDGYVIEGDDLLEIVGARTSALDELLIAKCGKMAPDEKDDFMAVYLLERDRINVANLVEGPNLRILANRIQRNEITVAEFSSGYIKYLTETFEKIFKCETDFLVDEQVKAFLKMNLIEFE